MPNSNLFPYQIFLDCQPTSTLKVTHIGYMDLQLLELCLELKQPVWNCCPDCSGEFRGIEWNGDVQAATVICAFFTLPMTTVNNALIFQ